MNYAYKSKIINQTEQEQAIKYWESEKSSPEILSTRKYKDFPYKKMGLLSYTLHLKKSHCTGIAVDLVFTPQLNTFSSKPKGTWSAKALLVLDDWEDEKPNGGRNVGFIILEKIEGMSIGDTVGKIELGQCKVNDEILSVSYHRDTRTNLREIKTTIERVFSQSLWNPAPLAIRSTENIHGGPWLKMKNGEMKVCSVSSFQVPTNSGLPFVYGSVFDEKVIKLYKIALSKD
eukprot:gene1830-972_t